MLHLRHDFCNIMFKIKHKLYIASGSPPAQRRIQVAHLVTLQKLRSNRKVPGSNPGPDTILTEIFWFSSVNLGKFRDSTSGYAPFPAASFPICYSLITLQFDSILSVLLTVPDVHDHVHKSPPPEPIMNQMCPPPVKVHVTTWSPSFWLSG
jgi:hypothetical protein